MAVADPVNIARLLHFSDDASDGLHTLIQLFLTDTGRTIEELAAAVERSDADAIRLLAHRAGGSSAVCGAAPLAALLFDLENRATSATRDDDVQQMLAVTAEFAAVSTFLHRYLNDSGRHE